MRRLREADQAARKPVIEGGFFKENSPEAVIRAWGLVTQALQEEMQTDVALRSQMAEFVAYPVDERLSTSLLEIAEQHPRTTKICKRYAEVLGSVLRSPVVPDGAIEQSIVRTRRLGESALQAEELVPKELLESFLGGVMLQGFVGEDFEKKGISLEEQQLLLLRYPFARDVKMLALAAVWKDHPLHLSSGTNEGIAITDDTQTGLKVMVVDHQALLLNDLLNPDVWKRRVQIKDRVYLVQVNNKKFILKEHKTNRHKDTDRFGGRETVSSIEEATIGHVFSREGSAEESGFRLSWERPIGAVVFPDGFQFSLFAFEEELKNAEQAEREMPVFFHEHWEGLEPEYLMICENVDKFIDDPIIREHVQGLDVLREALLREPKQFFTKELFLDAWRRHILERAKYLPRLMIKLKGYRNIDPQEPIFRLSTRNNTPVVEYVGYDFEYFELLASAEEQNQELKNELECREADLAVEAQITPPLEFLAYYIISRLHPYRTYLSYQKPVQSVNFVPQAI